MLSSTQTCHLPPFCFHTNCLSSLGLFLFTPLEFFPSVLADGFSLKSEWQQVSSSLQDSSQYSGRPPTSRSSIPFSYCIVTFMVHSFFNSLARSRYLSFFSLSFRFILISWDSRVDNFANSLLFLLLIIIRSSLLAGIRWSVCMLKSHRSLCVAFSRTGARLCIYHLLVWSNLNFLYISLWITLPTQSCLALYSLCANLLHSLILWLMVSSLSPHSLHLLFCWVLSILTLIWLVLTVLSCAAIRRDSVSLLKFPFLSHFKVLSCEILFIIIIPHLEFFTSVLADGFSLEFEWQQVSSSLQDSGRSQQCCYLDSLYLSPNFQVLQAF